MEAGSPFELLAGRGKLSDSFTAALSDEPPTAGGLVLRLDPKTPRERWGTGALNQLPDEFSDLKHMRGTVSAVRIPGKANSGGAQFFICVSPQPQARTIG